MKVVVSSTFSERCMKVAKHQPFTELSTLRRDLRWRWRQMSWRHKFYLRLPQCQVLNCALVLPGYLMFWLGWAPFVTPIVGYCSSGYIHLFEVLTSSRPCLENTGSSSNSYTSSFHEKTAIINEFTCSIVLFLLPNQFTIDSFHPFLSHVGSSDDRVPLNPFGE